MYARTLLSLLTAPMTLFAIAQNQYAYTSVPGDPIGVRIYKLDNGLTVYLSRNEDAPRIQTNIAVRAGSKHDPADATGLAHYLEHMLFKGTSRYGTSDWEQERVLLDRISELYEQRRATRDETERDRIYAGIDSLSGLAARLAIPSEYDKMISSIGARGTNAYTSVEQTVYINDIPSDEMEKWMMVEAERFNELVLRLFHTELETVYEEFNRSQDNDRRSALEAMSRTLFRKHPYGTQTTIGTGEHLKNPSMVKIHAYFNAHYVPNNMAIIMAGDLDFDRTIALIDKHFGAWRPKDVPHFQFEPEEALVLPEEREVFGPMAGWVDIGWRLKGKGSEDEVIGGLVAGMLSNGRAGLFDLDLVQAQKVLNAVAFARSMQDHGQFMVSGNPKQGQDLEQVRDLLLAQVDRLARGDFDDRLMEAVVNDLRQRRVRSWSDENRARASAMTEAFTTHREWKEILDLHDRMARVTRQQVMDFARRSLGKGHVVVFKRTGENKDAHKVPKPKITPVPIEREAVSAWRAQWEATPSARIAPVFVDFGKSIARADLRGGVPLAAVANTSNDLFSLHYIVDMGTDHDAALRLAVEYLPYLGTSRLGPADLKKELFHLGLRIDVNVGEDRTTISLSGLEKNLARGVELLEQLLADARPNEEALAELINDIAKERQDRLKNKGFILGTAMFSYARYGERSPLTDALSVEAMRAIPAADLTRRIQALTTHKHRVFYYGRKPIKEVKTLLDKAHRVPAALKEIPAPRVYTELETTTNTVLFLDHDMVQTEMMLVSKARPFDVDVLPYAALFNEYFGSGLSSIVFQEIREAKALAYSANASYITPSRGEDAHYVRAMIGTQADKLNDAVDALLALLDDMPMAADQYEGAKLSALKVIESGRITRDRIYWTWESMRRLGLDRDIRRTNYERIPGIGLQDMKDFFDREIKGRHYTYLVIGKRANLDFKTLERLGPVRELTKKEVFGYDEEL
ncbi:MAG: insulinase family protein [Flavobacteriales bacterium]|nr:insulinase family protein [Flavobacteriales bacterium]